MASKWFKWFNQEGGSSQNNFWRLIRFQNRVSVGARLLTSYLLIAAIMAGVAALGYFFMRNVQNSLTNMHDHRVLPLEHVGTMEKNSFELMSHLYEYYLISANRAETERQIQENIQAVNDALTAYQSSVAGQSQEEQDLVWQFQYDWAEYQKHVYSALTVIQAGNHASFLTSVAEGGLLHKAADKVGGELKQLSEINVNTAQQLRDEGADSFRTATFAFGAAAVFGIVVALFLGVMGTLLITRPLAKTVEMIQELESGHLSRRLNLRRSDEIGVLADRMDAMADGLQNVVVAAMQRIAQGDLNITLQPRDEQDEVVPALIETVQSLRGLIVETNQLASAASAGQVMARGRAEQFKGGYREIVEGMNNTLDLLISPLKIISEAAGNLSTVSAELLAATSQQATGASEQSAAISQTTTTVEEVKAITENAILRTEEVAAVSRHTVEVSRAGQQAVMVTIDSMNYIKDQVGGIAENILALSKQTQQIGEIISTVSEIAEQSNMLALNASIEAARAGEAGRGFAVVAAEVRSLAEQSRKATEQIKAILSSIQKATNATVMATEEGIKVVDKGVNQAGEARAAIDQLSGVIDTSMQTVTQLAAGSQQQRTGVEQIAAAMHHINQATFQGLASTRQTERSAVDLNQLSQRMSEAVQHYQLN